MSVVCKTEQTESTIVLPDHAWGGRPIKEEEKGLVVKEEEEEEAIGDSVLPNVQQLSHPESPQIKEEQKSPQIKDEQDLWTSQGKEQLPGLQSDTTDSIFTSPRVKTHWDPEDSSHLPHLHQTPTMEHKGEDSLPTNIPEIQIKVESDEEDCGAPEPASDSQPTSVSPDCPTAQSLKEEERGELLPDLKPIKSRRIQAECSRLIPSPCSSPDTSLRTKTSPSPWTRPITSSCSGSESEDVSSGEAESKKAEKPHQCEECDTAFSSRDSLVQHRIIHTGRKSYQCDECDKAFSRKSHLVIHRRIHTGEKPYQCEECDEAFSEKGNLVKHRRLHTGDKPYQCEDCDKAFSSKSNLIIHGRIHTGQKPYPCDECEKTFSTKSILDNHRRVHTGDKPYQCEECDKAFSRRDSLVKHGRIHTGDKPYQCDECDKAFSQKGNLVKHRRIHK